MADASEVSNSKRRLKMWIMLLGVTRKTESHLREFLRVSHGSTLPRFDVMAALFRRRDGVTMSELSRLLLVSNGNATAIVDRLEKEQLVKRKLSPTDRRSISVALTAKGLAQFEQLASDHEREVNKLFAEFSDSDVDTLTETLKRFSQGEP